MTILRKVAGYGPHLPAPHLTDAQSREDALRRLTAQRLRLARLDASIDAERAAGASQK